MRYTYFLFLVVFLSGPVVADDTVIVATASNFAHTFTELAEYFSAETGIAVTMATGSTGKLYAQIINGAPFDVFLAADAERPALLEESGRAVQGSRFTYATGRLVLWSRDADDCLAELQTGRWVAMANPTIAPYGRAAQEFLQHEGYWDAVAARTAYAENVMQVVQFVASGNADVGFVAASLLAGPHAPDGNCAWPVPEDSHSPLRQQAVILTRAAENKNAVRLFEFLQSDVAAEIVASNGYGGAQ